jgi:hypothetical protein
MSIDIFKECEYNHHISNNIGKFKMTRQMHLQKSGSGMAAKTACGRNILRTPMSTSWTEFRSVSPEHRCEKCDASKQAELNRKADARRESN